jgi:hypothetical protein
MNRMPVDELKTHPVPINKVSARVAFFRGDSFLPLPRTGSPKHRRATMLAPPAPYGARPDHCENLTGERFGSLTFLYWYCQAPGAKQVWVTRCDCGRYELRNESASKGNEMHSRWRDSDCCERCKDDRVATGRSTGNRRQSEVTRTERTKQWVSQLLSLGLTAEEVVAIYSMPAPGIATAGKTAAEIRQQLQEHAA